MPNLWNIESLQPRHVEDLPGDTLVEIVRHACERRADRVAMRHKTLGLWHGRRWGEVAAAVREIALGFAALGLEKGECVGILAGTRIEWVWCDLAVLFAGGVSHGIDVEESASQVQSRCAETACAVLVVEDEEQLDKALAIRAGLPRLRHVVVMEARGLEGFADPGVVTLEELRRRGAGFGAQHPDEFDRRRSDVRPEDPAVILRGADGGPSLVHTQRSLAAAVRAIAARLPQDASDERMCFAPLCDADERIAGCYTALFTGAVLNFAESAQTVPENVREVAPTVFAGEAPLWAQFHSEVEAAVAQAGAVQRALYAWAFRVGDEVVARVNAGRDVGFALRLKYRLAGFAALDHVRRYLGLQRCRVICGTGGEALPPALARWYLALGVPSRAAVLPDVQSAR
jgi:long-chain acyl-CoA synthetase